MTALPVDAVVKACSCGRAYDADWWSLLPLVGYVGAASGDESQVLELRNCRGCGSTLGLDVKLSTTTTEGAVHV
jgi:hypothetical protein